MRRIETGTIMVFVAILVAAALAFHGLTNHLFWDDEANTAIFGRNLLKTGKLTAWDGRNLMGYRGGAELDEDLVNVYMPPMQYYVAAVGLSLFGESTFGGRALFVIAGLAGIALLAVLMRHLAPHDFPWWLPSLLLAVTPAYLLYIRNCRYYSLGVFFTLTLLAACSGPLNNNRRAWITGWALGLGSTVALVLTNYINAAAAFSFLPVLLLWAGMRTRRHLVLQGAIYATAGLCGLWVYLYHNPLAAEVASSDPTPAFERFLILLWWHAKGLATFEFVPVLLIPVLTLPFLLKRLSSLRSLAGIGAALVAMLAISCLVTAFFSPQPLPDAVLADMRYQVPLIAIGAGVGGITIFILFRTFKPLGLVCAAILVLTNILQLGFLAERSSMLKPRKAACTLCQYVWENTMDYKTSTETIIDWLARVPEGRVVYISPEPTVYAPMFYLPKLLYAGQLTRTDRVRTDLVFRLPEYLFVEPATFDLALIRGRPPKVRDGSLHDAHGKKIHVKKGYKIIDYLPVFHKDCSRPEIPWHAFSPKEFEGASKKGFFIAEVSQ